MSPRASSNHPTLERAAGYLPKDQTPGKPRGQLGPHAATPPVDRCTPTPTRNPYPTRQIRVRPGPPPLSRKRGSRFFRIPQSKAERKRQNFGPFLSPSLLFLTLFIAKIFLTLDAHAHPKNPPREHPAAAAVAVAGDCIFRAAPPPMAEGSSRSFTFGGSLVLHDPEVVEVSPEVASGWSAVRQKRKRAQVVPHEIIELDADDDPDGVTIDAETSDHKKKQAIGHPMSWQQNAKSGLPEDFVFPSAIPAKGFYPLDGLGTYHGDAKLPTYGLPADIAGPSYFPSYSWKSLGTYHTGTIHPAFLNGSLGAVEEEDYAYDEDEFSNYMHNTPPMENGSSFNLNVDHYMGFPPIGGSYLPSGHVAPSHLPLQQNQIKIVGGEVDEKYKAFKQFDTVGDHSDHFYFKYRAVKKPSKDWVKRIQHEWKVLGKDLPVYANTLAGEKQSLLYNEETFLLSCRTMLYSLRNPPKV
uniref:Uncharacterized protein n=1 Tax=Avena sativa TaxID=4498 RepID=A0ACD5VZB5_AVESA